MSKRTILALVDFSETTPLVLDRGVELAAAFDARLVVMHVVAPDPAFIGFDVGPAVQSSADRDIQFEQGELQRIVEALQGKSSAEVEPLLIHGPVVEKAVAEAKHLAVDYLVLGSHGHGALYHMLMGSITQGVLRDAPCPVVIVPPP